MSAVGASVTEQFQARDPPPRRSVNEVGCDNNMSVECDRGYLTPGRAGAL